MKKEYTTPVVELVEGNELEGIFCIGSTGSTDIPGDETVTEDEEW